MAIEAQSIRIQAQSMAIEAQSIAIKENVHLTVSEKKLNQPSLIKKHYYHYLLKFRINIIA